MKRFRTTIIGAGLTVAAIAGLGPIGTAAAAGDPYVGMQLLDELCASKGGLVVNSPYAISRCQAARSNKGFETEQLICEGLLDGRFVSAVFYDHHNRTSWSCIAGSPG
jgi:hypothetical protein